MFYSFIYKKYTNPYEFINTIIPGKNKCIAKYKPLSRSYFKMIEILHFFFLDEFVDFSHTKGVEKITNFVGQSPEKFVRGHSSYPTTETIPQEKTLNNDSVIQGSTGQVFDSDNTVVSRKPIRSFHLAEGPGGFIEALANTRNNPHDVYVGITILESRHVQTPPVVVGVSRNQPGTTKGVEKVTNFSPQVGQSPEKFEAKLPLELGSDHNIIPEVKEKEKCSVPDTCNKNNVGKHNKSVPGWKKSDYFLKSHPNIHIETGADKTGNILSMDNFLHCRAKYGSSMDLITGDGGFDFSADFNNQEMNITKLLFAQMCYALCLQKHNGSFILKIFDCFMEHTVDILYILSAFYETVYITKPKTSRYANSEKYLVCKNFLLFDDSSVFPCLKMAFQKMLGKSFEPKRVDEVGAFDSGLNFPEEFDVRRTSNKEGQSPVRDPSTSLRVKEPQRGSLTRGVSTLVELFEHENISRFLKIPIPAYFIYKLEEYNTIYGQQQIENIYQTIVLIEQIRPEQEDKELYYGNNSPQGSLTGLRTLTRVDALLWKDAHLPEKFVDFTHTSSERSLWGLNPCGLGKNTNNEGFNSVDFSHTKGVEKVTNFVGQSPEKFDHRRCSEVPQSSKINNLIRTHIRKCVHWCLNHNIPYNIMDD